MTQTDKDDVFDPLHGRAYNSTRVEIQKCWRALRKADLEREAAIVRDPSILEREDVNIDVELRSGAGTPNQLLIARHFAKQHLDERKLEDIQQGRLRW